MCHPKIHKYTTEFTVRAKHQPSALITCPHQKINPSFFRDTGCSNNTPAGSNTLSSHDKCTAEFTSLAEDPLPKLIMSALQITVILFPDTFPFILFPDTFSCIRTTVDSNVPVLLHSFIFQTLFPTPEHPWTLRRILCCISSSFYIAHSRIAFFTFLLLFFFLSLEVRAAEFSISNTF